MLVSVSLAQDKPSCEHHALTFFQASTLDAINEPSFNELIQTCRLAGLSDEEAKSWLRKTPFVNSLGVAALNKKIFVDRSWEKNLADMDYALQVVLEYKKRLELQYLSIRKPDQLIDLLFKLKRSNLPMAAATHILRNTQFAQHFKITKQEVDTLYKSLYKMQDTKYEAIGRLLSEEFPGYHLKKWKEDSVYDVELPELSVRDQCSTGTCWLQAATTDKDQIFYHETGIKEDISAAYTHLQRIKAKFSDWLDLKGGDPEEVLKQDWKFYSGKVLAGSVRAESIALDQYYGTIPEKAWTPLADPFERQVNREVLNAAQVLLKDTAIEIKSDKNASDEKKKFVVKGAIRRFNEYLESKFGKIPDPDKYLFKFQEDHYTPKSFTEKFFSVEELIEARVDWHKAPIYKAELYEFYNPALDKRQQIKVSKTSMQGTSAGLLEIVKNNLDEGVGVEAHIFFPKAESMIDEKSGEMNLQPDQNLERTEMGHALYVVGYELDLKGNLKSLKVKNSWGEKAGNKGYFRMSVDFFKNYAYLITGVIYKKPQ